MKTIIITSNPGKFRDCDLKEEIKNQGNSTTLEDLEDFFENKEIKEFENIRVQFLHDSTNIEKIAEFVNNNNIKPDFVLLHESKYKNQNFKCLKDLGANVIKKSHDRNGIYHIFFNKILDGSFCLEDVENKFSSNETDFIHQICNGHNLNDINVPETYQEVYEVFRQTVKEKFFNEDKSAHLDAFRELQDKIS